MADALYTLDGDRLLPGPMTVGPWSPDAQHGGPVAALLARAVENVETPVPMQVVRLTVELLRPVPLTPLDVRADLARPGKKVGLVDASIFAGAIEVARARALRIRTVPVAGVPVEESPPPAPPPHDDATEDPAVTAQRTAFAEAVEMRFIHGGWDAVGPATMWTRLAVPVVEGEEPSPLQRTAAAADFANGVSRVLSFDTHTFINPDLTVALARIPVGEWIGFDMVSRLSADGFGQAESRIFDTVGTVGRSVQSLIVDTR